MDIIVNDFSLDGQFRDIDEFIDSIYENTIPAIDILESIKAKLLSSYDTYNLQVTADKTLYDLLMIRGVPEIQKFKRQLQELFIDEPYWNADSLSENKVYECEYTKEKSGFCIAEALERECPVISFEHQLFKNGYINLTKSGATFQVINLFSESNLLSFLREQHIITHLQYLVHKYSLNESFGLSTGSNYFDELIQDNSLSSDDIEVIINDLEKLIVFINKGQDPGRLSKTIEGKLKEFRTSLSNRREIRIFFF